MSSTGAGSPSKEDTPDVGADPNHTPGDGVTNNDDAGRHSGPGTDVTPDSNDQGSSNTTSSETTIARGTEQSFGPEDIERPITPEGFAPGSQDAGPPFCNSCRRSGMEYHHTPLWCYVQTELEEEAKRSRSRTRSKSHSGQRSKSRSRPREREEQRARSMSPLSERVLPQAITNGFPVVPAPSSPRTEDTAQDATPPTSQGNFEVNPRPNVEDVTQATIEATTQPNDPSTTSPSAPSDLDSAIAPTGDSLADMGKLPENWADDEEDELDHATIVEQGRKAGFSTLSPEMRGSLREDEASKRKTEASKRETSASKSEAEPANTQGRRPSATSMQSYFSDTTVESDGEPSADGEGDEQEGSMDDATANSSDDAANLTDNSAGAKARRLLEQPSLPPLRSRSQPPAAARRADAVRDAINEALFNAKQHCNEEKAALERRLIRNFNYHFNDQGASFEKIQTDLCEEITELVQDKRDFFDHLENLVEPKPAIHSYSDAEKLIRKGNPGVSNKAFREQIEARESAYEDLAQVTEERDKAVKFGIKEADRVEELEARLKRRDRTIETGEQEMEELAQALVDEREQRKRDVEELKQTLTKAREQHELEIREWDHALVEEKEQHKRDVEERDQALMEAKAQFETKFEKLEEDLVEANRQVRLRNEIMRDARVEQDRLSSELERTKKALEKQNDRASSFFGERETSIKMLYAEREKNEELLRRIQRLEAVSKNPQETQNLIYDQMDRLEVLEDKVDTLKRPSYHQGKSPLALANAKIQDLEDQLNAACYALSRSAGKWAYDEPIINDSNCNEAATKHRATIHRLRDEKRKADQECERVGADLVEMERAWRMSLRKAAGLRSDQNLSAIYDKFTRTSDTLQRFKRAWAARYDETVELREALQRVQHESDKYRSSAERVRHERVHLRTVITGLESQTKSGDPGSPKSTKDRKHFWMRASPRERRLRSQELIAGLRECARVVDARHYDIVQVHRSRDDKVKFHLQRKKPQKPLSYDTIPVLATEREREESDEDIDKIIRDGDDWQKRLKGIRSKWPEHWDYDKPSWSPSQRRVQSEVRPEQKPPKPSTPGQELPTEPPEASEGEGSDVGEAGGSDEALGDDADDALMEKILALSAEEYWAAQAKAKAAEP